MEVSGYGSPLVVKSLLIHVIVICLRICPIHPSMPHFSVPPYMFALPFACAISAPNVVLYY